MSTASVIEVRKPSELDRHTVREFFYAMPLVDRGKSLFSEMCWVLEGRKDEEQHIKTLPDYCYNIFDALRITFFKNFPPLTDIILIKDSAGMAEAKTIEAAKKVIQIDWKKLGRTVGVGLRCLRFAEKEAEMGVDGEALGHNSKAVHRAYAKRALMKIPSLEEYENQAALKATPTV